MGRIHMTGGIIGATNLDEVTANANDVVVGKVFVDAEGEPIVGTLPLPSVTATADKVLTGNSFVNSNGELTNGSMSYNEDTEVTLNCGESHSIEEGYHTGGSVTANSLESQTQATASAAEIVSGFTAWVKGQLLEGTALSQTQVEESVRLELVNALQFSNIGVTTDSTLDEILAALATAYPNSIYIWDNYAATDYFNECQGEWTDTAGVSYAQCDANPETSFAEASHETYTNQVFDVTNYNKVVVVYDLYSGAGYGTVEADIYINSTSMHHTEIIGTLTDQTAQYDISSLTGNVKFGIATKVASSSDTHEAVCRLTIKSIKLTN